MQISSRLMVAARILARIGRLQQEHKAAFARWGMKGTGFYVHWRVCSRVYGS